MEDEIKDIIEYCIMKSEVDGVIDGGYLKDNLLYELQVFFKEELGISEKRFKVVK